ncbi:GNAT family N-acetyltransferase [Chitinophaga sp. MM2321]|uniref:GNAT family N-acetyltransferase n=1 Tax=Chitinophaga sp. MM2321 TaxID=3137178 RepID=UPI0032D56DAE
MQKNHAITQLSNADSEQIINLILPIQQIENNVPVTLADQPDLLDIENAYIHTGGGFWGYRHEGEIVGTIGLINIGNHGGTIRKMFVKKEYRGKELGVAQLLLEALTAYCKTVGITDLYLGTVHTLKAAIRFYERNGFQQTAKADLPASFPVMQVDDTFFHLNMHR